MVSEPVELVKEDVTPQEIVEEKPAKKTRKRTSKKPEIVPTLDSNFNAKQVSLPPAEAQSETMPAIEKKRTRKPRVAKVLADVDATKVTKPKVARKKKSAEL